MVGFATMAVFANGWYPAVKVFTALRAAKADSEASCVRFV